jgi:hypothetical protein
VTRIEPNAKDSIFDGKLIARQSFCKVVVLRHTAHGERFQGAEVDMGKETTGSHIYAYLDQREVWKIVFHQAADRSKKKRSSRVRLLNTKSQLACGSILGRLIISVNLAGARSKSRRSTSRVIGDLWMAASSRRVSL